MRKVKWIGIAVVLIALAVAGYFYWRHQLNYPSTSDAYVHAHTVHIAPQVTGKVVEVAVHNFELVNKGQLLIQLDPEPFQLAVQQAQAQLTLTKEQIAADKAAVTTARAVIKERKADLNEAQANARRIARLVQQGNVSKAQEDNAQAQLKSSRAAVAAAEAQLQQAQQKLGNTGYNNARLKAARAALQQAQLDLRHTRIYAPSSGTLAQFSVRPGDVVEKDSPLFVLVENGTWWVDANYKETDLERIKPGQEASVTLDLYPGHNYPAVVESISPASGVAFSLLPPENATGNWVKVTQRFPVRVRITSTNPRYPLRIGASAEVTVNTVTHRHG